MFDFRFRLRVRLYISTLCSTLCFDFVFDFKSQLCVRLYVSTLCSTLCFDRLDQKGYVSTVSTQAVYVSTMFDRGRTFRPSFSFFEFDSAVSLFSALYFDFVFDFKSRLCVRLYVTALCSTLCFDFVFDFMLRLCVRLYVSTLCSTSCFDFVFVRLYVSTLCSPLCFDRLDYVLTLSSTTGCSRLWVFGPTLTCTRPALVET